MNPDFLLFANRLADISGERIRRYFRKAHGLQLKADLSPVTLADREAESLLREAILKRYLDHGILGEEHGAHKPDAEYVWVLDPVDGTRAFIAGVATFGTLIALAHKGEPVLGLIDQPITRERWTGGKNVPSRLNGEFIATRRCESLNEALLSTTSPDLFAPAEQEAFRRVQAKVKHTLYGKDCYAYAMLASGHIDLVIEAGLKPHDFCALAPVIANAGGVMTGWDGAPLTLHSDGRVIAAATPALHREAMEMLK
jgi:histidinol phosphatase-like enzyme (inositol monophosphatase family)